MITLNCVASLVSDLFDTPDIHTEPLKSVGAAGYFQSGSAALVEVWHTVGSVWILPSAFFFNFLTSFILKIRG
jgi:hypothetical protein